MASDAIAATPGDFSNLVFSDPEVGANDPHAGDQHHLQTGDPGNGPGSRDLSLRAISSMPVPGPTTAVLVGPGARDAGCRGSPIAASSHLGLVHRLTGVGSLRAVTLHAHDMSR
jgi:hypothetical protein